MTAPVPTPIQPSLETPHCDLCHSDRAVSFIRTQDFYATSERTPAEWQFMRCADCGLIYLSPRPTPAEIGAYYPDLDYHAFQPPSGLKARVIGWLRNREARTLLRDCPPHPRVLEIGCGTGDLLATLRGLGADVLGIEPNAAAAELGRSRAGLSILTGTLDSACASGALEGTTFDLILMRYALEHVHSPRLTLTQIAALLTANGRAVFWVPNADSTDARLFGRSWRGLDAPRHLYVFTPNTMGRLAEAAGLRVERIDYSGVPNDWAGSAEHWLHDLHPALARLMSMGNPLVLAAWLPLSAAAALARRAGRMRVSARRA
jgi:SAM-dependent methyltransferase